MHLCENCGRPAAAIYTLEDGTESAACADPCVPDGIVSARSAAGDSEPVAVPDAPLTVPEAAERERVSERTIRRALPTLAADGGAWQLGTAWRIDPAALTAHRARPRPRAARLAPPGTGRRRPVTPTTSTSWGD